ncbi:MAG: hypothetical protein ACYCYP_03150 [Leptospirales bacterium]
MSTAHFRITYDGPALDNHAMDARELAGALFAVGDLFEDAGSALYGDEVKTNIKVQASFRTGSFGIDLSLHQNILHSLIHLLDGNRATAIANAAGILALIGMTGNGLIGLLKWVKGRRIKQIETKNEQTVVVILEDEDQKEVEVKVIKLYLDIKTRGSLLKVLAPVYRTGIESITFGDETQIGIEIRKEELDYFTIPPQSDDLLLDEERTMALSIISLAFKEENKWRLSDGTSTIYAEIVDRKFLDEVDQNLISFSKGDVLMCRVHVSQWQTAAGVKTEYIVEEILEHRSGRRQLKIPFTSPD